jgi:hypothetical protein
MKVLLHNTCSKTFFVAEGKWSKNVADAWDFKSFNAVFDYVKKHPLPGVEVFYSFSEPAFDFALQLPKQTFHPATELPNTLYPP